MILDSLFWGRSWRGQLEYSKRIRTTSLISSSNKMLKIMYNASSLTKWWSLKCNIPFPYCLQFCFLLYVDLLSQLNIILRHSNFTIYPKKYLSLFGIKMILDTETRCSSNHKGEVTNCDSLFARGLMLAAVLSTIRAGLLSRSYGDWILSGVHTWTLTHQRARDPSESDNLSYIALYSPIG